MQLKEFYWVYEQKKDYNECELDNLIFLSHFLPKNFRELTCDDGYSKYEIKYTGYIENNSIVPEGDFHLKVTSILSGNSINIYATIHDGQIIGEYHIQDV